MANTSEQDNKVKTLSCYFNHYHYLVTVNGLKGVFRKTELCARSGNFLCLPEYNRN